MGIQDRDWYRKEQRRRRKLYWNERSGEIDFDHGKPKRRWRWPYQLRPDLPWWVKEWFRAAVFFGALGLLYLVWTNLRR